jgi:hypothetical protein
MATNLCSRHMHDLSDEIKRRGLWPLVRPERAAFAADVWLHGVAKKEDIDPLVISYLEIMNKARACGVPFKKGECCLCALNRLKLRKDLDTVWIGQVIELMVKLCETNGVRPVGRARPAPPSGESKIVVPEGFTP